MILTDILKVIYAPHKVFKQIVQNPKYLGAFIVLLLFVAAQVGFYYSLYTHTYYEQTRPDVNSLDSWVSNTTIWSTAPASAQISLNYMDNLNNSFYGNNSIQFEVESSSSISASLNNFGTEVDCGSSGFNNVSLRVKIVEPSTIPESVVLYLYSQSSEDYFQYDLTSEFDSVSPDVWTNITLTVGDEGWTATGSPNWQSITSLKLETSYAAESNITMRITGLFFGGIYETPIQTDFSSFVIYVLQLAVTQFLFEWLILTGILYIIIKVMKGDTTWKPIFVAIGYALIITIIQSLINIAATQTLPAQLYYPVELLVNLPGEAVAINVALVEATATYSLIAGIGQLASYVWIAGLGAFIVRALKPEFTWTKCILASSISLIATIFLLTLLGV